MSGFGCTINVDKRKLVIHNKSNNKRYEFYPHKIDHDNIVIDGHYGSISFEALRWLSKHGIQLTLLNWNGNLLSTTLPQMPKNGKLRICQYQKYLDAKFRHSIAYKIIQSKINNSQNILYQLSQYYQEIDYQYIKNIISKECSINTKYPLSIHKNLKNQYIKTLMTLEGRIAAVYWNELTKIFEKLCTDFSFDGRKNKINSRNYNASDEINALLNYGYAILESEIKKAINSTGLDPAVGFLHEVAPSKEPLVYDIQELFRWMIDLSVIQLLEEHSLKKSDFIITENYHTRLKENTAKMLIEKIKSNFNTKVSYKQGKKYHYQVILADIVQSLSAYVLDKKKHFDILIPELILLRNDTIDVQKKILGMTSQQRKQLGINKSTLWYIKQNIDAGKSLKIYNKTLSKLA